MRVLSPLSLSDVSWEEATSFGVLEKSITTSLVISNGELCVCDQSSPPLGHSIENRMSFIHCICYCHKSTVIHKAGRKFGLAFHNVDQVSVIESIDQHGEQAPLSGAVVHENRIVSEVVKTETDLAIGEHVGNKVDVDSGDSLCSQVMKETSFNCVWKCDLYVQKESRGYFTQPPCVFDLGNHEVHCICGAPARATTKLHRWKEVVFFCDEGKVVSNKHRE